MFYLIIFLKQVQIFKTVSGVVIPVSSAGCRVPQGAPEVHSRWGKDSQGSSPCWPSWYRQNPSCQGAFPVQSFFLIARNLACGVDKLGGGCPGVFLPWFSQAQRFPRSAFFLAEGITGQGFQRGLVFSPSFLSVIFSPSWSQGIELSTPAI